VLWAPTERIFGNEINGRHHDPYTVMRQFAGAPVARPYVQPVTDLAGRALGRVLHPVAAYNVVVLATFPLAAVFGCLLAFVLTESRGVSVAAGLAFAFSPFHLAQAVDHPHIAQVQWIPLFLLALWWSVHGFTIVRGALLVAATALVALSNFYGALIAASIAPFALVFFWLSPARAQPVGRPRDLGATAGLLLAMAVAGLAIVSYAAPSVLGAPHRYAAHPLEPALYSARWWTYLLPPVDHAVMGEWASRVLRENNIAYGRLESQIYLGAGVLLLATAGLWRGGRRGDERLRAALWLAALGLVAFAWSLPPVLRVGAAELPGPSAMLYALLPMFRAFARFAVVVQLAAVLIAALGAMRLLNGRTRPARVAVWTLAVLVLFEYAPVPWRWRDVLPTSGHRWLVQRGGAPVVFDCTPLALGERHTAWLAGYRLQHHNPLADDCADPDVATRLRLAGFTHLIARGSDSAMRWLVASGRPGLTAVYRAPDATVFEVGARPEDLYIARLSGLYHREYAADRTWRWSGGDAGLTIVNLGTRSRKAILSIQLQAAAAPRRLLVSLEGEPIGELLVTGQRATYALGPLALPAGESRLQLRSEEPPVAVAARDGRPRDRRPLAFAIGEWSWEPADEL
jgi:hypothetical protein